MDDEIQLISDEDGLAVIGDPTVVQRFLVSEGLESRDLGLQRLGSALGHTAGMAQVSSGLAANSGRWVQLTEESAKVAKSLPWVRNSTSGNLHATLRAQNGQFAKNLQFVQGPLGKGAGTLLTNPAVLAGAAGLMAQLAMQQSMDEITDYLVTIDAKVNDVLRAQKDAVLADMIGVDFVIEEAMTIREHVGRVSDVTWSKVQATSVTISRTQGYALRQLDALAEKVEMESRMGDLAKLSKEAESKVQEWLSVLGRCFQLHDAIAVLELDRVLDASPEELESHRVALKVARQNRLQLISRSTGHLVARLDAAAGRANAKVLLHPTSSRAVVASSNHVAIGVVAFQVRLGIQNTRDSLEAQRWVDAVVDVKDRVLHTGAEGLGTARQFGDNAVDRAKSTKDRFSSGVRAFRKALKDDPKGEPEEGSERPSG